MISKVKFISRLTHNHDNYNSNAVLFRADLTVHRSSFGVNPPEVMLNALPVFKSTLEGKNILCRDGYVILILCNKSCIMS